MRSLDTERSSNLYNVEKERIKWSMEKEHMKEALGDFEEKFKKVEREKDRFKSDVERLKAEKKNSNRTHSYINSLKTTYEPVKVHIEETNKENSNQQ